MGGTSWSNATYTARMTDRKERDTDAFDYDRDVKKSGVLKVHELMDPKGVIRESRDSDAHPTSRSIVVMLDVTGSMSRLPGIVLDKLKTLMSLLIKKGFLEHPQIMFGGIGDATCDKVPLQVGQFESGIEMDDDLSRFVLEGGGGGSLTESYELAMYFLANKVKMDCLEKRDDKGYCFIIGDELAYNHVSSTQVNETIGDSLQANIKLEDVVEQLRDKFEVFILRPNGSFNFHNKSISAWWKDYFGQNVIEVEQIETIAETIASLIGLAEGKIELSGLGDELRDVGVDDTTINAVTTAIEKYSASDNAVVKNKAEVEGELVKSEANVELV